ncbi:hypothetical protein FB45DRAFT_914829 [Roridomyces roridus]|uniref:C2H2-type domain-containing protein n=1 Tax=Roridomyces roridus TaxID=1738132 RepID=A0AAD7BSX1_9AGAR|nr:hypothetical protein FB45DRAFT_914829 [Roridomyces roridus]
MAYCDRCDRGFVHGPALRQHEENSPYHHICYHCDRDFTSAHGLTEHFVQSPVHHYCQRCSEHFSNASALLAHLENTHHYCSPCGRTFQNDVGLHEHYRQSAAHHYCGPCRRLFQSASNLNSHLNSSTHRPKDVPCPSRGCGEFFISRSAMILHLEAGRCPSGATRSAIDTYVRQYDRNNIITDPARLLTSGTDSNSNTTTWTATHATWNGSEYECYLCHAGFRTLAALNQHLASPRHQEKIYVCPLNTCRAPFSTLSGLCQHIESERCGVSKFRVVQNAMDDLMGNMRRLTF